MIIEGIEVEDKATAFLATCRSPQDGKINRREVRGHKFTYHGATWYLHRGINDIRPSWGISEASTGTYAAGGKTRAGAIQDLQETIKHFKLNHKQLARYIRISAQSIQDLEGDNGTRNLHR